MKFISFFLLFLIPLVSLAQERDIIQGKIVARTKSLQGIYVSNINTGEAILTSKGGYFGIEAMPNDTLMFSGVLFIGYRRVLDELDFKRDLLFVPLEENELVTQLDEIIISSISSESLGIVPKGMKRYTPAERRLYTATSGSGLVSVDMIVNAITGRTKMLKKARKYEQQEILKENLLDVFSVDYIHENYNIPEKYVKGFVYFAVSDDEIISLLKDKAVTNERLENKLGELAINFLDLLKEKENANSLNNIVN